MIHNSSNADYHADRTHLSSSALKLLLKDPAAFERKYVQNIHDESEAKDVFDVGTYVHALCLEPQTIAQNFAFYEGLRRQGAVYKEFVANHPGKIILSAPQKIKCEQYFNAYNKRGDAVALMQGGFAEHTMTGMLLEVPVKVRADYINVDKSYIVDIKTTSDISDVDVFKMTIERYNYDLSAALYINVANQIYDKIFDFYFVVISKTDLGCAVYKLSEDTFMRGAGLMLSSLRMYKRCKETGRWQHEFPTIDNDVQEV